jgi:uncharacterized membrane protein YbhN (UPF0104 family)
LKQIGLMIKIAITVALLAYAFSRIELSHPVQRFFEANSWMLIAGLLVLGLQPLIGALRWWLVLVSLGARSPLRLVTRWTYVGVFFSQVLPATIGGDAVRIWLLHRAGCTLRTAISSVGLDRAVMLFGLATLFAFDLPWLARLTKVDGLQFLAVGFLVTGAVGLGLLLLCSKIPARLKTHTIIRGVVYLAIDAQGFLVRPGYLCAVALLSYLSYFNIVLSLYLFSLAFGASPDFVDFCIVIPPVLVASTVPISIGGWGTREIAMISALATVGINSNSALSVSVSLGIASILVALPALRFYVLNRPAIQSGPASAHSPAPLGSL